MLFSSIKQFTSGVAFCEDSNVIVSVSWDKKIYLIDSRTGELIHEITKAHANFVSKWYE